MRNIRNSQAGFTAIELLITLFVAAGFLVAGYQLFNVIIKDGGQARAESRAGNVAYDYLRRYTSLATNPCVAQTPLNNSSLSVDALSNVKITVTITCPAYSTTSLSRIEVVLTYNTPQQTVKYSTLVNGTGTQVTDITDGLVGWWKFNGNGNTSVGTANGTLYNVTSTAGQSGLQDTAYSFNGTDSHIDAQLSIAGGDYPHTVSLWIYPRSLTGPAGRVDPFSIGNAGNNTYSALDLNASTAWYFYNNDTAILNSAPPLNQWSLLTFTYIGGGGTINSKKYYLNGTNVPLTTGSGGTYGQPLNLPASSPVGFGYDRGRTTAYFNGNIDDVRIYSRALLASEISTLYSGGAK